MVHGYLALGEARGVLPSRDLGQGFAGSFDLRVDRTCINFPGCFTFARTIDYSELRVLRTHPRTRNSYRSLRFRARTIWTFEL